MERVLLKRPRGANLFNIHNKKKTSCRITSIHAVDHDSTMNLFNSVRTK